MDPKYYGFIEMGFTASIVFGLGFWQLCSLARDAKRARVKAKATRTPEG